ncbi:uncharacterized protein LOC141770518 isoform X2 [Sebastes fasciatus]|uniref:uncharacterized protein LOC141770518 isoform X2 n=1 Tax=Sebastes fasciatus TaxID=394691 RepID=UPI003D9EED7B
MTPTLLSVALLLLLPVVPAKGQFEKRPINILVKNSLTNSSTVIYHTYVVYRGILLGGMRRLQDSMTGFKFNYTENADYGPFLESVNGLAGNQKTRTYWELLVKTSNGTIRPDVGIGCYIPNANDTIILNYNTC